jgi:lipid-binding SYLF domain-containing protein
MRRFLLGLGLGWILLLPGMARAQGDMQALVDRSTLTLQDMVQPSSSDQAANMLQRARAALICPRVFKAGFIVGGSGGECVLAARAANGTWSYPAFFAIGSASVGLQLGLQDSEVVMMVMTNRGLNALLSSHFTFGADASAVVATFGGGVQGATTTAAGADIVAFVKSRGAFVGLSLSGSVLSERSNWDEAYYGRPVDTRAIVVRMAASNPGADPLRALLTRYGSGQPAAPPARPGGYAEGPAGAAPAYGQPVYGQSGTGPTAGAPVALSPSGPIEQQPLPPPPAR